MKAGINLYSVHKLIKTEEGHTLNCLLSPKTLLLAMPMGEPSVEM